MDKFGKEKHLFERLDQANILLTGLKSLIESQNSENRLFQNKNDRLVLENKILVKRNVDLLKKVDSFEKALKFNGLKLHWVDSIPVIEKSSNKDKSFANSENSEEDFNTHDITTSSTNGLAEVRKRSNDLSVLKNSEEIDFESLSARLLQKAIETDFETVNANRENQMSVAAKNQNGLSNSVSTDVLADNTSNNSMLLSQNSLLDSVQESVQSKITSSFNDVDDSPSHLQVQQSVATSSKNIGLGTSGLLQRSLRGRKSSHKHQVKQLQKPISHVNWTVSKLMKLRCKLSKLSDEEKRHLKESRPTPDISIIQECNSKGIQYKRKFNKKYYHKHDWLCGCPDNMALYCFPCLLFGGDDLWTIVGFKNISKISTTCQKHEHSATHIDNMLSFALMAQNSE